MNNPLNFCLLISLSVFPLAAQETARREGVAPQAESAHKVRFDTGYDKFEKRTTVKIDPEASDPTMDVGHGIVLKAFFRFKGEALREPVAHATLKFSTDARDWRFVPRRDLIVWIDGERISFANRGRVGEVAEPPDRIRPGRTLYFGISRDVLAKIAYGRVVEMKLGSRSFKLAPGQLEVLRDLLERMNPS